MKESLWNTTEKLMEHYWKVTAMVQSASRWQSFSRKIGWLAERLSDCQQETPRIEPRRKNILFIFDSHEPRWKYVTSATDAAHWRKFKINRLWQPAVNCNTSQQVPALSAISEF